MDAGLFPNLNFSFFPFNLLMDSWDPSSQQVEYNPPKGLLLSIALLMSVPTPSTPLERELTNCFPLP